MKYFLKLFSLIVIIFALQPAWFSQPLFWFRTWAGTEINGRYAYVGVKFFSSKRKRYIFVCEEPFSDCVRSSLLWPVSGSADETGVRLYTDNEGGIYFVHAYWISYSAPNSRKLVPLSFDEEQSLKTKQGKLDCRAEPEKGSEDRKSSNYFHDLFYIGVVNYYERFRSHSMLSRDPLSFIGHEIKGETLCHYPSRG